METVLFQAVLHNTGVACIFRDFDTFRHLHTIVLEWACPATGMGGVFNQQGRV